MLAILKIWYKKYFSNPEAVLLLLLLLFSFGLIVTIGHMLAPIIVILVIVYLLQSWINCLVIYHVPKKIAYLIVFTIFLAILIIAILVLLPLLWRQISNLFTDLPHILQDAKLALINLAEKYPAYFSKEQIDTLVSSLLSDAQVWAKTKVSYSLSFIPGIIEWVVYLFLVPLVVFFFLKDRDLIVAWVKHFLPKDRKTLNAIWVEMDKQIGNYIRGKILQITIVSVANAIVFLMFNLNYAILLAFIIGFSVIIPYVGSVITFVPLLLVGYLQWGVQLKLLYMLGSYLLVQAIDANVLVPILFSKAVNLHPIAIVIAILFFGSIMGIPGVIFAIPLATLVKTIIGIWPLSKKSS